jgi:hypothetical protein
MSSKGGNVACDDGYDSAGIDSNGLFESDHDDDEKGGEGEGEGEGEEEEQRCPATQRPRPTQQAQPQQPQPKGKKVPVAGKSTETRPAAAKPIEAKPAIQKKNQKSEDATPKKPTARAPETKGDERRSAIDSIGYDDEEGEGNDESVDKSAAACEGSIASDGDDDTRVDDAGEDGMLFDSSGEKGAAPSSSEGASKPRPAAAVHPRKAEEKPSGKQHRSETKRGSEEKKKHHHHQRQQTEEVKKKPSHASKNKHPGDVVFNEPTQTVNGITRYRSFTVKMGPGPTDSYDVGLNSYVECPPPAVKGRTKADAPNRMLPMIMGKLDAIAHDDTLRGERTRIQRIVPWDKIPDLPDWVPVKIEGFPAAYMLDCWNTITYASNLKNIKPIVVNESNSEQIVNFSKVLHKDIKAQKPVPGKGGPGTLSQAAKESGLDIKTTAKYWVLTDKFVTMYYTYTYETGENGKRSRKKSQEPSYKFLDVGSIDASQTVESYLANEGFTQPPPQACLRDEAGYQRKKRSGSTPAKGGEDSQPASSSSSHSKGSHHPKASSPQKGGSERKGKRTKRTAKQDEDIMVGDGSGDDAAPAAGEGEEPEVEEEEGEAAAGLDKNRRGDPSAESKKGKPDEVTTGEGERDREKERGKRRKTTSTPSRGSGADGTTAKVSGKGRQGGGDGVSTTEVDPEELKRKRPRADQAKGGDEPAIAESGTREQEVNKRMKAVGDAINQAVYELKQDGLHRKHEGVMLWTKMASGIAKSAAKFGVAHK